MATQLTNWTKYQVPLALALLVLAATPSLLRARKIPSLPKPEAPVQQQPVATTPVIRTESRVVLVDAVVTEKKELTSTICSQKDFKVYEDNKEQAVTQLFLRQ